MKAEVEREEQSRSMYLIIEQRGSARADREHLKHVALIVCKVVLTHKVHIPTYLPCCKTVWLVDSLAFHVRFIRVQRKRFTRFLTW